MKPAPARTALLLMSPHSTRQSLLKLAASRELFGYGWCRGFAQFGGRFPLLAQERFAPERALVPHAFLQRLFPRSKLAMPHTSSRSLSAPGPYHHMRSRVPARDCSSHPNDGDARVHGGELTSARPGKDRAAPR